MHRLKLFLENMVIFGIGGVISKIIPIIMVPIITRLLPNTSYYGLSDLCSTMISFGSAIAVMGMYDALFRLFFDREKDIEYQKQVCSTAYFFTQILALIVCGGMILFRKQLSTFVYGSGNYVYLVVIAAIGSALTASNTIISAPTRMQNKRKVYLTISTILPIVSYSIAIPLILKKFYVIALPIAIICADTVVIISYYIINHQWFSLRFFRKQWLKPLLKLSVPLFPTFLIYWIFNSSDKLMISNFLNVSQVGIYSAGSKLGNCSQIIYLAFSGGWSYFAFKTMNDDDQVKVRGMIFEYLGVIAFSTGILVFATSKIICSIIYSGDYQKGYIVAPYLFMAPLTQMLFQVVANQFTIQKKTWLTTITLSSGAFLNVILNMIFIPRLGIEGAAIASLMGYIFSTVTAVLILNRMHLINLSNRCIGTIIITIVYVIIWRWKLINKFIWSIMCAGIVITCFVYLYRKDLKLFITELKCINK